MSLLYISPCSLSFLLILHFYSSTAEARLTVSTIAPAGYSSGFLLREPDLPPVQLERPGWSAGVRVAGGHSGFPGLHGWEQDPGHPQSPPPPAHATPTQVCSLYTCVNRLDVNGKHPVLCFSCVRRVISRAPGLKLVVETLITSLRPIGNIVLICCAFFIIFGILGVQVG